MTLCAIRTKCDNPARLQSHWNSITCWIKSEIPQDVFSSLGNLTCHPSFALQSVLVSGIEHAYITDRFFDIWGMPFHVPRVPDGGDLVSTGIIQVWIASRGFPFLLVKQGWNLNVTADESLALAA